MVVWKRGRLQDETPTIEVNEFNKVNKVLEYFENYKDNLKKLYLGYNEEALNGIIKYLAK